MLVFWINHRTETGMCAAHDLAFFRFAEKQLKGSTRSYTLYINQLGLYTQRAKTLEHTVVSKVKSLSRSLFVTDFPQNHGVVPGATR